jgi:ATP-dependent RNA helicase CshB
MTMEENLKDSGFTYVSPIQEKVIPRLLKGRSVLALAETGSGKTLAYAVPIVNDLVNSGHVQAVILSPTAALLGQIREVLLSLLKPFSFPEDAIKAIYGNKDITRAHPDIILTTVSLFPKLLSSYPMNDLKRVVIDEGDMIAFDGFDDVLGSLRGPKEKHQISFFSASLNVQDVKRIQKAFGIDEVIDVRAGITSAGVDHHLVSIRGLDRKEALRLFLAATKPFKAIVFFSTKDALYETAAVFKEEGIPFLLVEGGLDKRDILRTLEDFKKDENPLLLATDYASRGLDIPDVSAVISYDLPKDSDYYFHRAGRSGRFDRKGDSFVFYDEDEEEEVWKAEELIRRKVSFDALFLSKGGLRKGKSAYQFKNLGKKDQSNDKLQKQIRHAVALSSTHEVKPNYKKKVRKAVEKVKFRHRQKIVLTNIARAGGDVRDFHSDGFSKKHRRH